VEKVVPETLCLNIDAHRNVHYINELSTFADYVQGSYFQVLGRFLVGERTEGGLRRPTFHVITSSGKEKRSEKGCVPTFLIEDDML
jgi:hypothetical protein